MPTYLSVALLGLAVAVMFTLHIIFIRWGFMNGRLRFTDETITGDAEMQNQVTGHGLSPGDVEKLPSYNYNNGDGEAITTGTSTCAICLENFSFGDKCRLLPQCKHSFHANCVDSWLMKSALCPICRGSVELITKDEVHASEQCVVVIEIPECS